GSAWLKDPHLLLSAMLQAMFFEKQDMNSIRGQIRLQFVSDVLLGSHVTESSRWWLEQLESVSGYCRRDEIAPQKWQVCQNQKGLNANVEPWSLAPLMRESLWLIYQELPVAEKLRVLRQIRQMPSFPLEPEYKPKLSNDPRQISQWLAETMR